MRSTVKANVFTLVHIDACDILSRRNKAFIYVPGFVRDWDQRIYCPPSVPPCWYCLLALGQLWSSSSLASGYCSFDPFLRVQLCTKGPRILPAVAHNPPVRVCPEAGFLAYLSCALPRRALPDNQARAPQVEGGGGEGGKRCFRRQLSCLGLFWACLLFDDSDRTTRGAKGGVLVLQPHTLPTPPLDVFLVPAGRVWLSC